MIKVIVAIPKRPDLSDEAFHAHWRDPHGRLALNIRAMRRYVQAHRIREPSLPESDARFEGFAEVWLDDLATALGLGQDEDYQRHLVPDEPNFCDQSGLRFLITREEFVHRGPPIRRDDRLFKVIQLVNRGADVSAARFADEWGRGDESLAVALGALQYVRCRAVPSTVDPTHGFSGVRELWWPDADTFRRARNRAPEAFAALLADSLADPAQGCIEAVDELRLLW